MKLIYLIAEHLRRHIVQSATKSVPDPIFRRPPEIANLNVLLFVQQQILWLQVTMQNAFFMQIVDSDCRLYEIDKGSFFLKLAILFYLKE